MELYFRMKLLSCLLSYPAMAKEELTGDEFKAAAKAGPVFTKFYAPWCGHCKKLAPAWTELAEEINGQLYFKLLKSQWSNL